ncbi:MAG: aminodeoxychorismate lyase [Gammaproteobacteria bacterium]|nr:aminodeoxychorismate lyase [Gammaproteobacteria bacterium]
MTRVLVNGIATELLSVYDRAVNYGDGVFETIAVSGRQLHYWQAHFQRLTQGCQRLSITAPAETALLADIAKLSFPDAPSVLKIVLTRGQGRRGYATTGDEQPAVILSLSNWPEFVSSYQQQGIHLRLCQHRLIINPVLAGIKHLNRLDQVMARNEWHNEQIQEGLMLDQHGYLLEGISTNLFVMMDNQWFTAAASECAVAGIMRNAIISISARIGIPIEERKIHQSELSSVQQMMVCNSIWGLVPVISCDQYRFQTGDICSRLQSEIEKDKTTVSYEL